MEFSIHGRSVELADGQFCAAEEFRLPASQYQKLAKYGLEVAIEREGVIFAISGDSVKAYRDGPSKYEYPPIVSVKVSLPAGMSHAAAIRECGDVDSSVFEIEGCHDQLGQEVNYDINPLVKASYGMNREQHHALIDGNWADDLGLALAYSVYKASGGGCLFHHDLTVRSKNLAFDAGDELNVHSASAGLSVRGANGGLPMDVVKHGKVACAANNLTIDLLI